MYNLMFQHIHGKSLPCSRSWTYPSLKFSSCSLLLFFLSSLLPGPQQPLLCLLILYVYFNFPKILWKWSHSVLRFIYIIRLIGSPSLSLLHTVPPYKYTTVPLTIHLIAFECFPSFDHYNTAFINIYVKVFYGYLLHLST